MGVKVKQFTGGDTLCSLLGVFQTIMATGHRVLECLGCSHLVCDLGGGVSWLHTGPEVERNEG